MVRSVIPDSDDESAEETYPHNFQSTIPPSVARQQNPLAPPALANRDDAHVDSSTIKDDANATLILGTGSTDSGVFQQIYDQHQLSPDATLPTPVSQPNIPIILDHSTPTLSLSRAGQSTPVEGPKIDSFSATSSANTIQKLKRSKTSINDSSFTSPEASKKENKMKRANSMKSYPHIIEGSQEDITVNVADTASYTVLSQKSNTYRQVAANDEILAVENSKPKDVYEFPGSSEPRQITKKMGAKTTMDIAKEKMKTYGKVRRSKTMLPSSSSLSASNPLRDDMRRDEVEMMEMSNTKLLSSSPAQEQAPRRSLAENIKRKKEEKAKVEREKASAATMHAEAPIGAKTKSPIMTYSKIKRSKTGVAPSSPATFVDFTKSSMDDISFVDKKRKSDVHGDEGVPFELPQAKRFQRRKSIAAVSAVPKFAQSEGVVLSSSQDDPVDQISDTVITPTAPMPEPLLKSSTNTVLVSGTKTSDNSSASNKGNAKAASHVDSNTSVIFGSNVSVVKTTTSPGNKYSGDKTLSTNQEHPSTPKLPCFNSSAEQAEVTQSVIKKVAEFVNSPAVPVATTESSSPLDISFDKGLVGKSIVVVTELTDSQKQKYVAVSVTGSEEDGHEQVATLPEVMSPARVRKWSGASSTVANSTWKDRTPGGDSGDRRAPTMEPLSSQPRPNSRRANKRSQTGLEDTTPSKRRRRSVSVHSSAPPSSGGSDVGVKPSSRRVRRSKTMAASDESAMSSTQPRRAHIVMTVTTYEKLKDPDAGSPPFPEVAAPAGVNMAHTQIESSRGTKRKSAMTDLDISSEKPKNQLKTQEELDFEMAKTLQEQMDKDDAELETRSSRRKAPSKLDSTRPEPEPVSSQKAAGLPPPEMYKPRLSSRRSKSLSAKADMNAPELFVDGLPGGRRGKGKKAASQVEAAVADVEKAVGKENVKPANATENNVTGPVVVDTAMQDASTPPGDAEGLVAATEVPNSFLNKQPAPKEAEAPAKVYSVPKKVSRAASKPSASAVTAQKEDNDEEVVAPKKRGRGAKALIDTDQSVDEQAAMEVDEQLIAPKITARGRAAAKRTASLKVATKPPAKSKEMVDTEDDDENEESPVEAAARSSRAKSAVKETLKPAPRNKEIIDTDAEDEDEEERTEAISPVEAAPPYPAPVLRTPSMNSRVGVTRKTSTPGFKGPTMTRNKSTSAETDVPQTPRKEERGGQEVTPKSTPPGTGATSHSPLRGGVVPLRVGLSKKTRLPSLLKIIRK